jgi:GNAT superfamily N-acetyltransferase
VSRPQVHTRTATPADLPAMLALWDELREVGGRAERALNPLVTSDVRERLLEVLVDPMYRVVLACSDEAPAGMAVMGVVRPDPLSEAELIQVSHVVVSRLNRHRGIGHALLAAAAEFAAERHVDHLSVNVYPSLRDASRFYARLGFAPLVVRRIAPASILRRRLDSDRVVSLLGETTARRRMRLVRPVPSVQARRASPERAEL